MSGRHGLAVMPLRPVHPGDRGIALRIAASLAEERRADFADWLLAKSDYYRLADARPDVTAPQNNINMQRQLGLLTIDIDETKHADLSLVDDAAKRRQH
jgi:hypothetical protein